MKYNVRVFAPLGGHGEKSQKKIGLTPNQVAVLTNSDERTIMNIKKYKANTTMEVLYPLICALRIDPRDIFCPEMDKESPINYQLQLVINDSVSKKCLAEFAAAAANKVKSIFDRGVYLGENTYQAASVRVVRLQRTKSARSRLQKNRQKAPKGFFDSLPLITSSSW